jgi:glycosyltransferase involved in cell wall biosynthesis
MKLSRRWRISCSRWENLVAVDMPIRQGGDQLLSPMLAAGNPSQPRGIDTGNGSASHPLNSLSPLHAVVEYLRIAQISQLYEPVPPRLYGGTERVVSWITEELVALGHDVTLFASGDSTTKAKLEPIIPNAIRNSSVKDPSSVYVRLIETVYKRRESFDILHFHIDALPFPLFSRQVRPFVTTLHGRLDLPEYKDVYQLFPDAPLVSVSNSQRSLIPNLNWLGTVPHGMPLELLTPQPIRRDYLAFLGRISPEKGIESAISIARETGMKLKIAAKIDKVAWGYFMSQIQPELDGAAVEYVGEIGDHEKSTFLSGAHALLFPIAFPEPFGLTMIEAMACGTPVIAFNRASVPEVVEDGVTGFIVADVKSAAIAVRNLNQLDRIQVRTRFEARFSVRRMVEDYLKIYEGLTAVAS